MESHARVSPARPSFGLVCALAALAVAAIPAAALWAQASAAPFTVLESGRAMNHTLLTAASSAAGSVREPDTKCANDDASKTESTWICAIRPVSNRVSPAG